MKLSDRAKESYRSDYVTEKRSRITLWSNWNHFMVEQIHFMVEPTLATS